MFDGATGWVLAVSYGALSLAFALTLLRMIRGPSLTDRVVALDLMAYLFIAFTAAYGIETGEVGLINVALSLGIFVFLGTIAYARYVEAVVANQEEETA